MSYILDALRKSEQERNRGEVPSLESVQSSVFQAQQQKSRRTMWLYLLLGANVLVAIFWLGIKFTEWQLGTEPMTPSASSASHDASVSVDVPSIGSTSQDGSAATAPMREPIAPAKVVPEPAPKAKSVVTTPAPASPESEFESGYTLVEPSKPPAARSTITVENYSNLPSIYDITTASQRLVPDLEFSSHMYSSDPDFRSVVINGDYLKEGDRIGNRVRLEAVTEEGVVLDMDGLRFTVSVMQDWSFD